MSELPRDPDFEPAHRSEVLLTVRPRRIAIYAGTGAAAVIVVMVIVAFKLRSSDTGVIFRTSDAVAMAILGLLFAGFGGFTAARQSFLQWYPPETVSCGRDFYGMIETFPLKRALPMIFKGSGDCSKVDWTFLGGSIANWSFVAFLGFVIVFLVVIVKSKSRSPTFAAA